MRNGDCCNCGECTYHKHDPIYDDWKCTNENSENYGQFTGYTDSCEEAEER